MSLAIFKYAILSSSICRLFHTLTMLLVILKHALLFSSIYEL